MIVEDLFNGVWHVACSVMIVEDLFNGGWHVACSVMIEDLFNGGFVFLQEIYGSRSTNVITEEIRKDCSKYQEGLTKASQSNMELHKAMNTHITNLKLLSGPLEDLEKSLPSHEQDKGEYH